MKTKTTPFKLALFLLVSTCFLTACDPVIDAPQQTISAQEANLLEENFKQTRANVLNESLGFEDTRDFWFSIDTLKQYIAYVEQEGKRLDKSNLGIRIYFGAYPQQGNFPDPGFATVFLVPTAQESQDAPIQKGFLPIQQPTPNQNIDGIDPLNFGNGGRPPNDY